jgi:hypothetical protein
VIVLRLGALALLAAGTAGAAPTPAAAAAPGWYGGTAAGAPVGFRVTARGAVTDLRAGRLPASCAGGTAREIGIRPGATGTRAARVRAGRVGWTTSIGDDEVVGLRGRATLAGRFSVRAFRGTLRVSFRWPDGASCRTRTLTLRAARRAGELAVPVLGYRIFVGRDAAGAPLELALRSDAATLRVARYRARMTCPGAAALTVEVVNPVGPDLGIADGRFGGLLRFAPPVVPGRAAPSGGAVEISGRVNPGNLDGAVRLTSGFADGSACDGGWVRFTLAGPTSGAVG